MVPVLIELKVKLVAPPVWMVWMPVLVIEDAAKVPEVKAQPLTGTCGWMVSGLTAPGARSMVTKSLPTAVTAKLKEEEFCQLLEEVAAKTPTRVALAGENCPEPNWYQTW